MSKANLLLQMVPSRRLLEYGGTLVRMELCGGFTTPFRSSGDAAKLQKMLTVISEGGLPSRLPSILSRARSRKEEDRIHFQDVKNRLTSEARACLGGVTSEKIAFEDFYNNEKEGVLQNLLEIQRRKGRDVPRDVSDVLTRPERYRYTLASLRALLALSYLHVVQNCRIDEGDGFDVQQLVYLVDLDLLITNDRMMRKLCEYTYDSRCRVLTPKEFVGILKSGERMFVHPSTGSG